MSEAALGIWIVIVLVAMLNGCAAGVVGVLHAWRSKMRRGGKVATAAAATAFLPASMFIPYALADLAPTTTEEPIIITLALAMVFVLSLVAALPGALIVARKLEQPGDEFRTFE